MERLFGPMILDPGRFGVTDEPLATLSSKNLKLTLTTLKHISANIAYDTQRFPWLKTLAQSVELNFCDCNIVGAISYS